MQVSTSTLNAISEEWKEEKSPALDGAIPSCSQTPSFFGKYQKKSPEKYYKKWDFFGQFSIILEFFFKIEALIE